MSIDVVDGAGASVAPWGAKAAGIFTWDIGSNMLYGDAVISDFFRLDADRAMQGLPLQDYIATMHPDDRPHVARAIHTAIVSGEPYQQEYRLVRPGGSPIWVLAIGHCFRNREGTPSIYAGVVYDITEQKNSATDGLTDHCHAALHVAERLGNPLLVALLEQAVDEASNENLREVLRKSILH